VKSFSFAQDDTTTVSLADDVGGFHQAGGVVAFGLERGSNPGRKGRQSHIS
jgi:hypothetical protein